ncbi:MAG TPA: Asp-tRNA(Asn)/Glu-tRNA(Gln) amidotransferase subunit GatA [Verrucomicrobiae bacterium]|nr:Asp-tRNA(Asn)/Glu-tRNA(Gln) amidotransferase subunit GatA [Verrucomicrobiae bacterium]
MSLHSLSIHQLREKLRRGECSAREATQALLNRIAAIDGKLKAYLWLNAEDALAQADAIDRSGVARRPQAGTPAPPDSKALGGVPIAIKDLINVEGQPCTCGSKILKGHTSVYDAFVIRRLRDAGAVLLGRTNMDEFAMGSSTENSSWGITHNPWDLERIPGGSSGGSAAAVAGDEAFAALGSDTGGSIRQPAALCGCVGLKPSYGRVSRYGLVAFASSLDQIGPFTKTAADCALMMRVLAGHDPKDSTSVPDPVPDYTASLGKGVKGLRIGLPREYFIDGMDREIEAAVRAAIQQLQGLGAEVVEISLPHTDYAVAVYYLIATAEASANLARFDGVRYGARVTGEDVIDMYGKTRGAGFGPEVKRRIILGTYALSAGYYDAYYLRAQKVRTLIRQDFEKAFEKCDVIVTPTSPEAAFRIGEKTDDPLKMYLSDIFTISANLGGVCGVSLPCGFTKSPRLPIGLQVLGKPLGEDTILRVAHAYEQSTEWHKERPKL